MLFSKPNTLSPFYKLSIDIVTLELDTLWIDLDRICASSGHINIKELATFIMRSLFGCGNVDLTIIWLQSRKQLYSLQIRL